MPEEEKEKITLIECTNSNNDVYVVFVADIEKFKVIDDDTTELFINTDDMEAYKCSFGINDLMDKIFGVNNYEIIKPNKNQPLTKEDLVNLIS